MNAVGEGSTDENMPADAAEGRLSVIDNLAKLFDAATVLVFTTAAVYFWGYTYYSQFCEQVGVSFQGIAVPVEDHLSVSWEAVLGSLFAAGLVLTILYLILTFVAKKWANRKRGTSFHILRAALFFLVVAGILTGGSYFMVYRANKDADDVLRSLLSVEVRDLESKVMEGRFVYLRDFGSVLLVGELDVEGKQVIARRLIKASHFSSYRLIAPIPKVP